MTPPRLIEPRQLLRGVIVPALASAAAIADKPRLADPRAAFLLGCIAIQESDLRYVRQHPTGPARSYWQIEGTTAVQIRRGARTQGLEPLLHAHGLDGPLDETLVGFPLSAAVMARLLLWLDPRPLPASEDEAATFDMYASVWRPAWFLGRRSEPSARPRWSRAYAEMTEAARGVL